jgi:fimbrial chaperone protein
VLQLAILSRIKLFVRPNNLAMQPEEALSQLRFERAVTISRSAMRLRITSPWST